MRPKPEATWTGPDEGSGGESSLFAWLLPKLVIAGLAIAVVNLISEQLRQRQVAGIVESPEEARRKRLERLEQQQQEDETRQKQQSERKQKQKQQRQRKEKEVSAPPQDETVAAKASAAEKASVTANSSATPSAAASEASSVIGPSKSDSTDDTNSKAAEPGQPKKKEPPAADALKDLPSKQEDKSATSITDPEGEEASDSEMAPPMKVLQLKRPPPEQSAAESAKPASKKKAPATTASPAAAATKAKESAATTAAKKPADATSDPKKKNKCSKKSPRDSLLQALSSITGMTVVTASSPESSSKKSSSKYFFSDAALPATITWKKIGNDNQTLFQPLRTPLLAATTKSKKVSYAPTKLTDRSLYKASDWYTKSKTWVRDHSSVLDNAAQEGLTAVLENFQQWIVQTVVGQWKVDMDRVDWQDADNKRRRKMDEDDDVDMGLFADTSYGTGGGGGGGFDPMGESSARSHGFDPMGGSSARSHGSSNGSNQNLTSLLEEVFIILQDGAACSKVLNKPFFAHLIQAYDKASNGTEDKLALILLQECIRRLPPPEQKTALEWDDTQRHIMALTNLLTLSPDAVKALAVTILPTSDADGDLPKEGKEWETHCQLRPLLHLAAFSVPRFNNPQTGTSPPGRQAQTRTADGRLIRRSAAYNDLLPHAYHSAMVHAMGAEYPVALYARTGYEASMKSYHATNKHARSIMKSARAAGALALKKLAASSTHPSLRKCGVLFDWIGYLLETNEPLVDMLQSDLLSPDSAQSLCASRPFLLGITSSLLQMCSVNLSSRLNEEGAGAFDYRFFLREGSEEKTGVVVPSKERFMVDMSSSVAADRPARFPGATEFFFLGAALLRISLHTGVREYEEFQSMLRNVFASIQSLATRQLSAEQLQQSVPGVTMEQYQKCSSVAQGWSAFVDDPDISPLITTFCLMQLQWVAAVVASDDATQALAFIPEWFVKLPSQWLAHVAQYTPHLLQPHQGEAAVQYATRILQAGTSSDVTKRTFSPPVLCQLIRIAGAFVREGVRRALIREKNKAHRSGRRGFNKAAQKKPDPTAEEDFELDIIDDRTLDIYSSFDKKDLGVTVFTNEFVARQLCPTLMRAYMAMDAVEGMDVEREHHFDKFQVKHEVADLLLRLWCHPNGQSKKAIVSDLDEVAVNEFCSSLAKSLGFVLAEGCQKILDIRDIKATHEQQFARWRARGQTVPQLSGRDASAVEHHCRSVSYCSATCRRLLMILCYFSKENNIAAVLGGDSSSKKTTGKCAASDLAASFLNMIDRLTDEDGGIHPEIEQRQLKEGERSAEYLERLDSTPPDVVKGELKYLLHSRRSALLEYGLDVSFLVHQFLTLAARWHLAAATFDKDGKRTSKFLEACAGSDICSLPHLWNLFRRLVGSPKEMSGAEVDNAAYILQRDGHVDMTIWKDSYKIEGTGPDKGRSRRKTAKQDRMSYEELEQLAELRDIEGFLNDLEAAVENKTTAAVAARWGTTNMQTLEDTLFSTGECVEDDDYTERLSDWVVSSDSFLSKAGNGSFAHSYDSVVRGRGVEGMGAGKLIAKEARKCMKRIPPPHPNTSVFVCFAEERTDLCKAIIVGAADTPFSLGMFEFDILFPTNYPQAPPLFNFKTTGDGRTRISSNLYNDGKVCISILGTANAWDDSQRWNPSSSSLAQVLASLQTQLLGDAEPYFSDGFGHESVKGTPAGERGSKRFNNKIRFHTLRYAIIDQLKHPPLGFAEVTKRHFALCRKRLLAQARLWTAEAKGTPLHKAFIKAYEELATLLSSDDLVCHKVPGQQSAAPWGAVPLHDPDYKGLKKIDAAFVKSHNKALEECLREDSKKAARAPAPAVARAPARGPARAPARVSARVTANPSRRASGQAAAAALSIQEVLLQQAQAGRVAASGLAAVPNNQGAPLPWARHLLRFRIWQWLCSICTHTYRPNKQIPPAKVLLRRIPTRFLQGLLRPLLAPPQQRALQVRTTMQPPGLPIPLHNPTRLLMTKKMRMPDQCFALGPLS